MTETVNGLPPPTLTDEVAEAQDEVSQRCPEEPHLERPPVPGQAVRTRPRCGPVVPVGRSASRALHLSTSRLLPRYALWWRAVASRMATVNPHDSATLGATTRVSCAAARRSDTLAHGDRMSHSPVRHRKAYPERNASWWWWFFFT